MPVCDHCMLSVAESGAVYDDIDGKRRVFCCHGCKGIFRLIHSEGLDYFYARRREWLPGPADTRYVDASAFLDHLRPAGGEIETDIILDGIRCASCVWLNERVLQRTPGITFAQVNYATHRAKLRWDPSRIDISAILNRIISIGYTPKPFVPKAYEDEQKRQSRDLLIRFGTAAFFSMQLMLFSIALYAGYFQGMDANIKVIFHLISFGLTTPVLFYSGWPLIKSAVRGLRNHMLNMDVLIVAGAFSAYVFSIQQLTVDGEVYFDTAAMIITLILLGRYLELGAKNKASETISRLMQLNPREARRIEMTPGIAPDDRILQAPRRMVAVETIVSGDWVEVVPGEQVPVDGIVESGQSEVDEALLTGESRPSAKNAGSRVFAGTVNLYGSFVFRVTGIGRDTVLAQIIQTVEDAQARRAPIQAFADRVVGLFVPAVLLIACLTLLGWIYQGAPISRAIMNAVSVMVIACPCALGLATPLAILIGTSYGASRGILIKGGDTIEKTGGIDYVVLDKTGTMTEGKPVLAGYFGVAMTDQESLLIAVSLERMSEHSLGKAIVAAALGIMPLEVSDFSVLPGRGIKGTIHGKPACIGCRGFIENEGLSGPLNEHWDTLSAHKTRLLEDAGSTIAYLCHDGRLAGIFAIADRVRSEAAEAVRLLNQAGLGVAMITGDDKRTAEAVARITGIVTVHASASPIEKAEKIRQLQAQGKKVLMVGDGINDAPALVQATVGAAMGRATDIALESADLVVMRPDLRLIADSLALAKKTFRIIQQNIFWAFIYNIVMIPLAIVGVLHPIMAAAAMALSSLTVVGNSLRARLAG